MMAMELTETNGHRMRVGMRALVAVDGSAPAVHACEMLSRLLPAGTDVRLLTVLSYGSYPYSLMGGHLSDEGDRVFAARREVEKTQDAARMLLEDAGFRVTVVHRFGYAPEEIIAELEECEADLLVLGRRGLRGPSRWLGSVSDRVVHRSDVPVLLVA